MASSNIERYSQNFTSHYNIDRSNHSSIPNDIAYGNTKSISNSLLSPALDVENLKRKINQKDAIIEDYKNKMDKLQQEKSLLETSNYDYKETYRRSNYEKKALERDKNELLQKYEKIQYEREGLKAYSEGCLKRIEALKTDKENILRLFDKSGSNMEQLKFNYENLLKETQEVNNVWMNHLKKIKQLRMKTNL